MPRHKQSERDSILRDTRQLLLQAATDEFAGEGYAGANINRISQAAGFAKGTIYNYFASKRALMLALVSDIAQLHIDYMVEQMQDEDDPERRLERFFTAGFSFVAGHPAPAQVMINTLYGPDAEFKQVLYMAYQPLFEFVSREIVATGIDRGTFRQVDPAATATLLMTIYLGAGSQVDEQGQAWLDPGDVASFAAHALRQTELVPATGE